MAANDPLNIRLGACIVTFGGQPLGLTKGGVDVEFVTETKKIEVDQFGKTPVNEFIMGRMVKVKIPLAETDVDAMHRVLSAVGSTLDPGVTTGTAPNQVTTGKFVTITDAVGTSLRASAQQLVLHPKILPLNDKSEDLIIPIANTPGSFTFSYKVEDERVFTLEFTGYPDQDTGVLLIYGDNT